MELILFLFSMALSISLLGVGCSKNGFNELNVTDSTTNNFEEGAQLAVTGQGLSSRSIACSSSQSGISINQSVSCFQVFQRNSSNVANIKVAGNIQTSGGGLQAQVLDSAGNILAVVDSIQFYSFGMAFELVISNVPAGGWYKLVLREFDNSLANIVATASIDKIGVGEVFITAGQSNSVGTGELTRIAPPPYVSSGSPYSGQWELAKEPMPFDLAQGGSAWPRLGSLISQKYLVPVSFTVVGCGGTQISQWLETPIHITREIKTNADNCLQGKYPTLNARLKDAAAKLLQKGGFRAILWHQGESDRGGTTASYYNRFKAIHDQLNLQLGSNILWGVAQATFIPDEFVTYNPLSTWPAGGVRCSNSTVQYGSLMAPIQAAQQQIWANGLAFKGPNTDLLIGSYRSGLINGYCIHFSASGVNAHADGWMTALDPILNINAPPPPPPSTPTVSYTVNEWLIKTPAERAQLRNSMTSQQSLELWNRLSPDQKGAMTETNSAYNIILAGTDSTPAAGAPYSANQWIIKSPAERAILRGQMSRIQGLAIWNSITTEQQNAMTVINQAYTDYLATGH